MCDSIVITDEQVVDSLLGQAVDCLQRRIELLELELREAKLLIAAMIQANGGTIHLSIADIVRVKPDIVLERIDDLEGMTLRANKE